MYYDCTTARVFLATGSFDGFVFPSSGTTACKLGGPSISSEFFFECLSSGYNYSICSYTRTPTPHTHHTHHPCTNSPTTTHRSNTVSFLRSPESSDSVGDGRVAFPLWLHAREADTWNYLGNYCSRWENLARASTRMRGGGRCSQLLHQPSYCSFPIPSELSMSSLRHVFPGRSLNIHTLLGR